MRRSVPVSIRSLRHADRLVGRIVEKVCGDEYDEDLRELVIELEDLLVPLFVVAADAPVLEVVRAGRPRRKAVGE